MLFYHTFPAVSNYIYFHTLKCILNPNYREKCAYTKSPSSSPECLLYFLCHTIQVIIIDLWMRVEKAIGFAMNSDWFCNCFQLTDQQTWNLHMLFWIVAVSELSFNDLLFLHYIHSSVKCKLCAHQCRHDSILNEAKREI